MLENNYNPEQQGAIDSVKRITKQLVEIENLEREAHQPIYNLEGAQSQAVADICLDQYPPYHVLEERLRTAVTEARKLGLHEDPLVKRIRALAFS